jgi:serine/threonine-protein kinase
VTAANRPPATDSAGIAALRILRDALDAPPEERDAFIAGCCGGDTALQARVQALLGRTRDADVDEDETDEGPAASDVADSMIGARVGAWRIVERIGRGGMGVVYRGTREGTDFAHDVAIKLIRRGFDFDDIRLRFLRERRILARLSHPNLARFIDGGVAPDGRPWFALEFVRGAPITRWCDARRLAVRARVRLFLDVCAAVQYAHAQLVVHRDLKPANVLVDDDGRIRLLDFGIARLVGGGDEDALATTMGQRYALTPEYAAPEQFSGETAGVATDVYALGAILYELVSGMLPIAVERGDLLAAAHAVRATPPAPLAGAIQRPGPAGAPTPAERLAARATSALAYRNDVRGDLARILDNALAKEPARRYATVDAFADDLARWLDGAPVRVSGNAFGYRLQKFIGRNRVAVAFALLAGLAIVVGMAATIWQAREARIQRDEAIAEAKRSDGMRQYLMLMFRDAAAQKDATRVDVRGVFRSGAERLFDVFKDQPETGQNTALMLSDLYLQLGDVEGATPLLERLLAWPGIESNPKVRASARYNLAQIELARGHAARARELLDEAQAYWSAQPGASALLNESRSTQAKIERAEGRFDQAIATLRDAIAERRAMLGKDDFEIGNLYNTLSNALIQLGRYEEAEASANESYAIFEHLGQAESDGGMAALNSRGNAALMMGRNEHSLEDYRRVAATTRALYGETTKLAASLNNLGVTLNRLGRADEAVAPTEEALRIALAQSGERSPLAVTVHTSLAEIYVNTGRLADADTMAQAALDVAEADYASSKTLLGGACRARARVRLAQGRIADARADLERATDLFVAAGKGGEGYIRLMEPLRGEIEAR